MLERSHCGHHCVAYNPHTVCTDSGDQGQAPSDMSARSQGQRVQPHQAIGAGHGRALGMAGRVICGISYCLPRRPNCFRR